MGKTTLITIQAILFLWILSVATAAASARDEAVLRSTLPNGLRVVIVRNTLAPVVSMVVNYLVGSNEEPEEFPGMAHAQEHMMFRGSPGLNADQLANIMSALGGIFNARTRQTVTQYFLTVPSKDLDVALHTEAVRMRGVIDSEPLWCRERGAIEQEVAEDVSDPEYLSDEHMLSHIFRGTPYAHTPLGSVSSFEKTTGAMLKEFHDTWYVPNNAILVIVGDVKPRKALSRVRKFFGPIPGRAIRKRPEVCPVPAEPETLYLKTDQSYGMARVSFRMPGSDSSDFPASQILADVLNSQRGSLFSLVPEGKAFYAGFSLNALPCAGTGSAVIAFPKGADASALAREIRNILKKDVEKGFSPELVEASKRVRLTKTELRKNSIQGLAAAWSNSVAINGHESPEVEAEALKQVSAADVNRVARKYLDLDHAVTNILTPEPSGKPAVSAVSRTRGSAESLVVEEGRAVALPGWASKALGKLTVPPFVVRPTIMTLPNGLRLVVQRVAVSNTVSLYGHIRNRPEMETPPGKEGVDQALNQLFPYGSVTLDRLKFQKALDDIGARESAGVDFTLQVLDGHFEEGVRLLAENQLSPALPEEGFRTVKKQLVDAIAGKLQSPDHLARHSLRTALFPPDDPALRRPTIESVSSLTLQDVRDYYKKVFRPDLTAVVIVGKITPAKARSVMEKYFGSWKAVGTKPELLLPPVPASKPSCTFVPDATRVQEEVTLAETIGAPRSYPDFYALNLGNRVLGGSTCTTRLYRDLREESGLVYYVSSSLRIRKTRSTYQVRYGCSTPDVAKVRSIVERNLIAMQTSPVSEGELARAKALLLRQMSLAESSVDGIAAGLAYRAAHDPPLEDPAEAARRYVKLTPEHVRNAFARWIRPADLAEIDKGPLK